MIRKNIFGFLLILSISIFSQKFDKNSWLDDLDELKTKLIQKEHLFKTFSKNNFLKEIDQLKKQDNLSKHELKWEINKILSHFKLLDLQVKNENELHFPFQIKCFQNKFHLTAITRENSYLLGFELIKINNIPIKEISKKLQDVYYLNHQNLKNIAIEKMLMNKPLLAYLNIIKNDTVVLSLKSKTNEIEIIKLPFIKLDFDELASIKPKKSLFNQRKNNKWFWKYGINFGQQVFLKYQVCASKEHIKRLKDSLNWTAKQYAKAYKIPLLEVNNAPEFKPFVDLVIKKFKKRRYKKLIIDLRNNSKGAFFSTQKLMKEVIKKRRINKKGRLFIITNINTNKAAISTILAFKKQTKVKVLGQEVFGTKQDSNKTGLFTLSNSKLKIKFPLVYQQEITITPNIIVKPTLSQYTNGVDPFLQKVLEY